MKENLKLSKDFVVKEIFGEGASSFLFIALSTNNNKKQFAIKYIYHKSKMFSNVTEEVFKKLALNEIMIHYNSSNKYINKTYGYYAVGDSSYAIVQELALKGNLKEFISKNLISNEHKLYRVSENFIKYVTFYIVKALEHLKSVDVIHQDIKLENILIDEYFNLKLTDFTVSLKLQKKHKRFSVRWTWN